jgi:N-acetyltransferase
MAKLSTTAENMTEASPWPASVTLERNNIRLEPLSLAHESGLKAAAADGELWKLWVTSVPEPENTHAYIETALTMRSAGNRLAFAVIDVATGDVLGSTSYHDIVANIKRVEIGYTWYAGRAQKTHINTTCKLLLMNHAFDTLGCAVVGWRTDCLNFASQQAIEKLGAHKDGVIRHHALRRDGTVRDTVMYSMLQSEWPTCKTKLEARLTRLLHLSQGSRLTTNAHPSYAA